MHRSKYKRGGHHRREAVGDAFTPIQVLIPWQL